MTEMLKEVPSWFLIVCITLLVSLLSIVVTVSFNRLTRTLDRFEGLFDKVFEKYEEHESRLSKLEGAHAVNHKD